MDGKTEQDRIAKVFAGDDYLRALPAWLHVLRTRWHLTSCPCRNFFKSEQSIRIVCVCCAQQSVT